MAWYEIVPSLLFYSGFFFAPAVIFPVIHLIFLQKPHAIQYAGYQNRTIIKRDERWTNCRPHKNNGLEVLPSTEEINNLRNNLAASH